MSSLLFLPPPLSKSWSLPSASIRDCLGYSPLCPHTVSSSATCSPVYPTRLFFFCVASSHAFFCLHFANLSLVSTSKQKRLSMDSVFRRMQDFSVSCVGPCGGGKRREVGKQSPFVMEDNLMKTFF